jgi:hypothetical protein
VVKVGLSAKFRKPWIGPFKVVTKRSRLNYVIRSQQGKENVHINRLKKAYGPVNWQESKPKEKGRHVGKRQRPKRRQPEIEQEAEVPSQRPIPGGRPLVVNRTPERRTPDRANRRVLDTPAPGSSPSEPPGNHRVDPTFVPSSTPTSRELGHAW